MKNPVTPGKVLNVRNLLACAILFLIFAGVGASFVKAAETPEQTAQDFYRWYLRGINTNKNPIEQKQTISKFVSKRLSKSINKMMAAGEYDADYFISAQDYDENWTVNVSKAKVAGNSATLKVLLDAPKGKKSKFNRSLSVVLIKEDGAWKIDKVNPLN